MRYNQIRYYQVYKSDDNYYSSLIKNIDVANDDKQKVDDLFIKSLNHEFVIVEKGYSIISKNRHYADYEIFQNGERKDIVMNGWTFPCQVGNAKYEWDYGFVHDYKCISPLGNKVSFYRMGFYLKADRMPVECILRL